MGKITYADGRTLEGEFRDGNASNAKGYLPLAGEQSYTGELVDGRRQGTGKNAYKDGSVYDGEWVNGLRHGTGRYSSGVDGSVYFGSWFNNQQHGNAAVTNADGSIFEGEFKEGEPFNGKGTVINRDGVKVTGAWTNGILRSKR